MSADAIATAQAVSEPRPFSDREAISALRMQLRSDESATGWKS